LRNPAKPRFDQFDRAGELALNFTNLRRLAQYPAPVRILGFLLLLVLGWLPFAAVIYLYLGSKGNLRDPEMANLLNIFVMGGLGGFFLLVFPWWQRFVYDRLHAYRWIGMATNRRNGWGLAKGWAIGFASTALLFYLQGFFGWLEWQPAQRPWAEIIGGGILSSFGVALAEEIVFRGWILTELEADYSPQVSLWSSSAIFAALHFLKPLSDILAQLPQFAGLWMMGMVLAVAKRSEKQLLGIAVGLHAGMIGVIYLVNVGQLIHHRNPQISDWITGIYGLPNAGLMGILGLTNLLLYFNWCLRRTTAKSF
jgi:uncharacterized protein